MWKKVKNVLPNELPNEGLTLQQHLNSIETDFTPQQSQKFRYSDQFKTLLASPKGAVLFL